MKTNSRKTVKGQSGAELVIVYGLVILMIGGTVVVLSNMGSFSPQACSKSKMGFASVTPVDWGVYYSSNDVLVGIRNDLGTPVELTGMVVTLDDGSIECSMGTSKIISPGESYTVKVDCDMDKKISNKYNVGSCYIAETKITFSDIENSRNEKSSGRLRGVIEELHDGSFATSTTSSTTTTSIGGTTTSSAGTSTTTATTSTVPSGDPEWEILSPPSGYEV